MKIFVNDICLNVEERGAGKPALVFLHFFGGSSRSWNEIITSLSSTHRCIAPDLRGFGDSDAAQSYSLDDNADDLTALVEYFDLKNYVVIGHSMGGKIALNFAARCPSGLEKLILLAPSPPTPEPIDDQTRAHLLSTHGTREAASEVIEKVSARELPNEIFERAIEDNLKTSQTAWRAWLEKGSKENIAARMEKIEVPVLVIGGEKDESMTPQLLQREIVDKLSKVWLHVIPNTGHLVPLEKPEETIHFICKMLAPA